MALPIEALCARFAAMCLFLRPKCEESRRGWVFAELPPRIQSLARAVADQGCDWPRWRRRQPQHDRRRGWRTACFDGECLPGTDPKASGGNATLLAQGAV
ncbi:hypothetical protein GALL_177500 [mine drainage metagenome]|uniref:Uncharacterized protein n=1 Tax=mine drainage metagenome TaxID=410659 RepID=A0A1J5RX80_9ZZZZ